MIGSESFVVPRIESGKKSTWWWCFVTEDGSPSYTGTEINPAGTELPGNIEINGVSVALVPVKKWDRVEKKYTEETYSFEKTRHFADYVEIEGVLLEIRLRVTAKKNGKWNLSCRAWQTHKPPGHADTNSGPIRPKSSPSNLNVETDRELPSGGIFDLFN